MLIGIAVLLLGLFARAMQVQWMQHAHWVQQAQRRLEDIGTLETSRGRILDYKGRELAVDAPCIDAVVDYRAIRRPVDERWVRSVARDRLKRKLGLDYLQADRQQQQVLLDEQVQQVKQDIADMWELLGDVNLTGYTPEQIEDRRQQIVRKVQMRKRYLWYLRWVRAERKQEQQERKSSWWQRWLMDDSVLDPDAYDITISEEIEPHVILPAVSTELANYLGKNADRFPGLSLKPGQHRIYPFGDAACHLIGNLGAVTAEDQASDPDKDNELRKYLPTDEIGRQGIEALCERVLRGTRGQWRRESGQQAVIEASPQPGQDVRISIDIELQKKAEAAFRRRKLPDGSMDERIVHGAAILIDVPTGEVRAMVSYPTYDLNSLAQEYARLVNDEINKPLLNRATMSQLEPGSTVKPLVGIAGISEKVVGVYEGIECTGYLQINGVVYRDFARCWSIRFPGALPHHGSGASPHRGSHGNPDGFLTYADALERSCNVWPETVAHRLGMERLMHWYGLFGLGRPTGIGIPEARGRLHSVEEGTRIQPSATWFAGIGQGIGATPIQMANVAATIARDGLWKRPRLVVEGFEYPDASDADTVKLPADPRAFVEAKRGMRAVIASPGGTGGRALRRSDLAVAGKTGTAQAARFSVVVKDENGSPVMENGKIKRRYLEPSTSRWTNPEAPWYRATGSGEDELSHGWFIGFAPADRPKVAFAVMVEYGGSGATSAGPIASALLDAAIEEGYVAAAR